MVPRILLPGKLTTNAAGVRGDSYSNGLRYAAAIARAGGAITTIAPVAEHLEHISDLVAGASGVLIQGGGDIDPARYGEKQSNESLYGIVDIHDELEFAVVREAIRQDKPLLGICRGMQVLNVALGGTLHQDLADVLEDRESHWNTYHPVELAGGSRIADAMRTARPLHSHSFHHQALKTVAPGLIVTGESSDGVIEAVEHSSRRWVVGVQWHPEDDAAEQSEQQNLFDVFVSRCMTAQ